MENPPSTVKTPEQRNADELLDVYTAIAELPDDEIAKSLMETYYENRRTTASGRILLPTLHGLPDFVATAWTKSGWITLPPMEEDEQSFQADLESSKYKHRAYDMHFTFGMYDIPGQQSTLSIILSEQNSPQEIRIRKHQFGMDGYGLYNETELGLGTMSSADMRAFLTSLSGGTILGDAVSDEVFMSATFERLGNATGTFERNHLITEDLNLHPEDNGIMSTGVVLFSEHETTRQSAQSFVIERVQKLHDLDADIRKRMKVSYTFLGDQSQNERTPAAIAIERIVKAPASCIVTEISCEDIVDGIITPLPADAPTLKLFVETLHEVIAARAIKLADTLN